MTKCILLKHKGQVATFNENIYNIKSKLYSPFKKIKQNTQQSTLLMLSLVRLDTDCPQTAVVGQLRTRKWVVFRRMPK